MLLSPARRGSLIAAVWLIGIGTVFLVREATDLSWGAAWPMFVILVGVGAFASVVADWPPRGGGGIWAFTWPIVWVVVGVVLMLSTTSNLGQGPAETLVAWWPWLAIALGAWFIVGALVPPGSRVEERLVVPLAGAGMAAVRLRFGAGTLRIRPAAAGNLVDGEFPGGVRRRTLAPGRVELEQDTSHGLPWLDHRADWIVGLTAEVPLDLRLETGANRSTVDLRELRVRTFELQTGASETRVILPRAAGMTTVRAEAGATSLTIEVPGGVAARIRTRVALADVRVDESRFPPLSAGGYQSPDYETATNRVDIELQGGVGSIRVQAAG